MLTHVHAADNVAVLDVIDPDATTASTVTTGWVDASDFHTLMAVVMAGTLGTSATIDAKLEQANTSTGGAAKDVSGSDITQMTQASTDQSDTQAVISMQCDALDVDNDFQWVRLSITVGTATSDVGGILLGVAPRVGPADDNDGSTVGEVVRV
jgi:hypothetical protein